MTPTFEQSPGTGAGQGSAARRKAELHEKLAKLNSRYVAEPGRQVQGEKQEQAKVGLAAIQDIAAKQESALHQPDSSPQQQESSQDVNLLRYDPLSNRMTLEMESTKDVKISPSKARLPALPFGKFPLEIPTPTQP